MQNHLSVQHIAIDIILLDQRGWPEQQPGDHGHDKHKPQTGRSTSPSQYKGDQKKQPNAGVEQQEREDRSPCVSLSVDKVSAEQAQPGHSGEQRRRHRPPHSSFLKKRPHCQDSV